MSNENAKALLAALPKRTTESETYDCTCHCGAVQYTVTLSPPLAKNKVVSCTCTFCTRNGYLLVYPMRSEVTMKCGEDTLKGYRFGKKANHHMFCPNCACTLFFDPKMKERPEVSPEAPDMLGVNVRMIKGVKMDELEVFKFDGYNIWPWVGENSHLS